MQTLEKSYEVAKQRLKESEDDRARLVQENQRLGECVEKYKQSKQRLTKEIAELK